MVRLRQGQKRRAGVSGKGEDRGDIRIDGGVAKIRLTPGAVLLIVLLAVVAVSIVVSSSRRAGRQAETIPAGGGAERTESGAAVTGGNRPPVVSHADIVPPGPDAATALNVRVSAADPEGDAITHRYRWFVDATLVQDGLSSALQPGPFRKGSVVYAEVIPSDPYSSGNAFVTPQVTIANSPPAVSSVTVEPEDAAVGTVLTASAASADPDGDDVVLAYQWRVNGNLAGPPIPRNSFDTLTLRKKDLVSVMVLCSDGRDSGGPIISNTVMLRNRKPEITSTAPLELTTGLYIYQVTAKDPDGDPLTYRLDRFPAGMTIDASTGLIRWQLTKGVMFTGRNEVAVSVTVDDRDGGTDSQEFTIIITELYVN